jgi:hypothetical protein
MDHKDEPSKVLGKSMHKIDEEEAEEIEAEFKAIKRPQTFDGLMDSNLKIIGKMVREKQARNECNL